MPPEIRAHVLGASLIRGAVFQGILTERSTRSMLKRAEQIRKYQCVICGDKMSPGRAGRKCVKCRCAEIDETPV
jgi:hypothetical protein